MVLTTQDQAAGYDVTQTLGLVRGNTIRARHVGKDILAGLRNLVGGEITEYTKMLAESREQAMGRMIAQAEEFGADGIVGIRFNTCAVTQAAAELLAYGTAVKLRRRRA